MHFTFELLIPRPLEEVFAFFERPGNMVRVFEGRSGFRLLHHADRVAVGAQSWVQTIAFGIMPVVLGFEHDRVDAPHGFSERLVHGPFSCFEHEHVFEARGDATLMLDRLEVCLPWWYGGPAATAQLVAPGVRQLFAIRRAGVLRLLNS